MSSWIWSVAADLLKALQGHRYSESLATWNLGKANKVASDSRTLRKFTFYTGHCTQSGKPQGQHLVIPMRTHKQQKLLWKKTTKNQRCRYSLQPPQSPTWWSISGWCQNRLAPQRPDPSTYWSHVHIPTCQSPFRRMGTPPTLPGS